MKLEEILKAQGLSDEQISGILKGMKDNKIYTTSLENADERYQKLKGQKDDIEGQLNTANTTIEDLKKNNNDNETLQKKIKEHEATIEAQKGNIRDITINNAISNLLSKHNVKYPDLLLGKFDKGKLNIKEDGSIEGLEEQFEGMKESYKDIIVPTMTGKEPDEGNSNPSDKGVTDLRGALAQKYENNN